MSVCRVQVNSPSTVQGVNILPGTYTGEEHRRRSADDEEPDDISYTIQLPVEPSGDGAVTGVRTLDVTTLVKAGAVTVIL